MCASVVAMATESEGWEMGERNRDDDDAGKRGGTGNYIRFAGISYIFSWNRLRGDLRNHHLSEMKYNGEVK